MKRIIIVGSGASGVHAALTALRKGHEVEMLDVGYRGPPPAHPNENVNGLKRTLADPVSYFLGEQFESVVLPGPSGEYYGFPPAKEYVFGRPRPNRARSDGFAPLVSFARGGLAEAWTGGAYPFNESELSKFPVSYDDYRPYYAEVADRIGINGETDDLGQFFPNPGELEAPLRLDAHSASLMAAYARNRTRLNKKYECYLGRSRLAVLSRKNGVREGCQYCGRCLWGCPNGALYTPAMTLEECKAYPRFHYRPDTYVTHFVYNNRRITEVACEGAGTGERFRIPAEVLVLAAGTLMTSQIFLTSIWAATGTVPRLTGLMDNRQVLIPFVNLRMVGRRYEENSYQYHQLAMGLASGPDSYIHCQITTLKSALIHPLLKGPPIGFRTALALFRNLRAALGLVNLNLPDSRREANYVTLEPDSERGSPRLVVRYSPADGEAQLLRQTVKTVARVLRVLGCVVPPGMTHVRPMGASVHYAGTIPMSEVPRPLTASPECRSHDFENLYFADGTTFPYLPAKNLTYTLMANAVRMADLAF